MSKVSRETLPADPWGEGCVAWRLLADQALAVAEEEMAPGTSETAHVHARARQFFYVLAGTLAMERRVDGVGEVLTLAAGEGLEMPPGIPHRAFNPSAAPVRFLVVSSPTTRGDRTNLA